MTHPSLGAIICHDLPGTGVEIPRHVSILPGQWPARGGVLGAEYDAFKIYDPADKVPDTTPPPPDTTPTTTPPADDELPDSLEALVVEIEDLWRESNDALAQDPPDRVTSAEALARIDELLAHSRTLTGTEPPEPVDPGEVES